MIRVTFNFATQHTTEQRNGIYSTGTITLPLSWKMFQELEAKKFASQALNLVEGIIARSERLQGREYEKGSIKGWQTTDCMQH